MKNNYVLIPALLLTFISALSAMTFYAKAEDPSTGPANVEVEV